jgi:hypothetical protein
VPNFVECLGDVEEICRTVIFIVKCFVDFVHDETCLIDGRVPLAEAELMVGYSLLVCNEGDETV